MADKKISQLTQATTPLAGTEVLPIVQSGTTVQVSVNNLTAGKAISVSDITNTSLTASKPVFTDANKKLVSTGTLGTTQGGTGLTSFTNKGVMYATSTSALSTSSDFLVDGLQVSFGGANNYSFKAQRTGTAQDSSIQIGGYTYTPYIFYTYSGASGLSFYDNTANKEAAAFDNSLNFRPGADNVYSLGTAAKRWSVVYAGTGTINTSDEREKQDVADLTEAERQVAIAIKGLIKSFRFKDAVESKGNDARIHFGVMAQQVAKEFEKAGLNANKYALFCYDEWDEQEEIISDGVIVQSYRAAGNRYGIRYDELLAFVIAAI